MVQLTSAPGRRRDRRDHARASRTVEEWLDTVGGHQPQREGGLACYVVVAVAVAVAAAVFVVVVVVVVIVVIVVVGGGEASRHRVEAPCGESPRAMAALTLTPGCQPALFVRPARPIAPMH